MRAIYRDQPLRLFTFPHLRSLSRLPEQISRYPFITPTPTSFHTHTQVACWPYQQHVCTAIPDRGHAGPHSPAQRYSLEHRPWYAWPFAVLPLCQALNSDSSFSFLHTRCLQTLELTIVCPPIPVPTRCLPLQPPSMARMAGEYGLCLMLRT